MKRSLFLLLFTVPMAAQTLAPSQIKAGNFQNGPYGFTTLNGVLNATLFTGSDIGAQINNAAAALPSSGGTIYIPVSPTCYSFTTPIVVSRKPVVLEGAGPGTCLTYTGTTGTAITFQDIGSNITYEGQVDGVGLRSIALQGTTAGVSGTATGLYLSDVAGFTAESVQLSQFHTGLTFGSNTWNLRWFGGIIRGSYQNIYAPNTVANAYEQMTFVGTSIDNGTQADGSSTGQNCVQLGNPGGASGQSAEFNFTTVSFDACQVVIGSNATRIAFIGNHFEDVQSTLDYPFVKIDPNTSDPSTIEMVSPVFTVDATSVTAGMTGYVELDGLAQLHISSGYAGGYGGTSAPPAFVAIKGAGTAVLKADGQFAGNITAGDAPNYAPPIYVTDGVNVPRVSIPGRSATASAAVSADGQIVLAQGENVLNGNFMISWKAPGTTHLIQASVGADAFASSANVTITSNYANSPVITGLKVVLSGAVPQLVATVGNRGGQTGPLTVQWYGDGNQSYQQPILLPGTTIGATAVTNYGTQIQPDGSVVILGPTVGQLYTPASSSSACTAGQFADDASYHYVCTATDTWKRVALTAF